jgi:hypothetical protein
LALLSATDLALSVQLSLTCGRLSGNSAPGAHAGGGASWMNHSGWCLSRDRGPHVTTLYLLLGGAIVVFAVGVVILTRRADRRRRWRRSR